MHSQKLYIFLIGSLLGILLLLTDSAFVPIEESSFTTETSVMEVSPENDKDFKFLTPDFKLSIDETLLNSHLYLNPYTSYSYASKLFRPPIVI